MEPISLAELARRADELDRLALVSPEIDRFCSSSSWILSAAEALSSPGEPWILAGDAGLVALVRRQHHGVPPPSVGGTAIGPLPGEPRRVPVDRFATGSPRYGPRWIVEPLEAAWGLACPLVGPVAAPLAGALVELLVARGGRWDLAVLSGMPVGSDLLAELVRRLGARFRIGAGPVTRRHVASLAGGREGFLARRSRSTRKGLRQSERRVAAAGIRFAAENPAEEPDRLFDRIVAIERRSWKAAAGLGLASREMREFYRRMAGRLARSGRLRCLFGRQGAEDVAYVLGAVFGDTYRGLQFSFDDRFRSLGLGNLAQLHQVIALEAEPSVTRYDLGTGGEYKPAWAEAVVDSVALVAAPGG